MSSAGDSLVDPEDLDYTYNSNRNSMMKPPRELDEDWDEIPSWCCLAEPVRFRKHQCLVLCSAISGLMIFILYTLTTLFAFDFVIHQKEKNRDNYYKNNNIPFDNDSSEKKIFELNLLSTQESVCQHYHCINNYTDYNEGLTTVTLNDKDLTLYKCCLTGIAAIPPLRKNSLPYLRHKRVAWHNCIDPIGEHREDLKDKCSAQKNISLLIPVDFSTRLDNGETFDQMISYRSSITPGLNIFAWNKDYVSYAWFIFCVQVFWVFSCSVVCLIAGPPVHKDVQIWLQNITLVCSLFILQYLVKLLQYLPQKQNTGAYCQTDSDGKEQSLTDPSQALEKWKCDDVRWINAMDLWMEWVFRVAVWCFSSSFFLFFALLFFVVCRACYNTIPDNNWFSVHRRRCLAYCEDHCYCPKCCKISQSMVDNGIDLEPWHAHRPSNEPNRMSSVFGRDIRTFSEAVSQRALSELSEAGVYRLNRRRWIMGILLALLVWANYLFGMLMFVTVIGNAIYIGFTISRQRSGIVRDHSENVLIQVVSISMSNAVLATVLIGITLMRQKDRFCSMCLDIIQCNLEGCFNAGENNPNNDTSYAEKESEVFDIGDMPVKTELAQKDSRYNIPSYTGNDSRKDSGINIIQPQTYQSLPLSGGTDNRRAQSQTQNNDILV